MSNVKKSERTKSKLEVQHIAYQIRKMIVSEIMIDFGTKTNSMPEWLIEHERKEVLKLSQGISIHLASANTIFPQYMVEFTERRLQMDKALECCNALQDELQFIVQMIPADKKIKPKAIKRERDRLKAYKRLLDAGRMSEIDIENAYKCWLMCNYKVMSSIQIQRINGLYKELFGREIRWKNGKLRYLTKAR